MWSELHGEARIWDKYNRALICLLISLVLLADEPVLDDANRLRDCAEVLTPLQDQRGKKREERDEGQEDLRMGVGKNTTSKMDSSGEAARYEEEIKHGTDFYPIPVRDCFINMLHDYKTYDKFEATFKTLHLSLAF